MSGVQKRVLLSEILARVPPGRTIGFGPSPHECNVRLYVLPESAFSKDGSFATFEEPIAWTTEKLFVDAVRNVMGDSAAVLYAISGMAQLAPLMSLEQAHRVIEEAVFVPERML